ncbi:hypothetical protein [Helicobacter pylori]|nr:hypothetical protein [Helicobacter pylori]
MSKIKPQIKKNNSSKSNYSDGWCIFGAVCMIGEMVFKIYNGIKKAKKK